MHKHMANYKGVKLHEVTCRSQRKSWTPMTLDFAITRSNGSIPLKIPSYNTTWSALHKHEWSDKKGWVTEQRTANVQMSRTVMNCNEWINSKNCWFSPRRAAYPWSSQCTFRAFRNTVSRWGRARFDKLEQLAKTANLWNTWVTNAIRICCRTVQQYYNSLLTQLRGCPSSARV